jgi:hypothetical protein
VELHDPAPHGGGVCAELVVVHGLRARHEQDAPAGVVQPPAEVGLVRVDEEVAVEPADLLGGRAPDQYGARLHPAHLAHLAALALHRHALVAEHRGRERPADVGQAPCAGAGLALAGVELSARRGRAGVRLERVEQGARGARAQL